MDKEIEDLATSLFEHIKREFIDRFIEDDKGDLERVETISIYSIAEHLVEAGYRKADEVRKETETEIVKLKSALGDAVRAFTRMETLYKLKCSELETVKESAGKETAKEILSDLLFNVSEDDCKNVVDLKGDIEHWIEEIAEEYDVEVDE